MTKIEKNTDIDLKELIEEEAKTKTKKPSMYKVLMLNDDFTPMDFVVFLLKKFFQKEEKEASKIMLEVHTKGIAVCGVYSFEIAETKTLNVLDTAKKSGHPLQCVLEKN